MILGSRADCACRCSRLLCSSSPGQTHRTLSAAGMGSREGEGPALLTPRHGAPARRASSSQEADRAGAQASCGQAYSQGSWGLSKPDAQPPAALGSRDRPEAAAPPSAGSAGERPAQRLLSARHSPGPGGGAGTQSRPAAPPRPQRAPAAAHGAAPVTVLNADGDAWGASTSRSLLSSSTLDLGRRPKRPVPSTPFFVPITAELEVTGRTGNGGLAA